jgi:hypothetical protein
VGLDGAPQRRDRGALRREAGAQGQDHAAALGFPQEARGEGRPLPRVGQQRKSVSSRSTTRTPRESGRPASAASSAAIGEAPGVNSPSGGPVRPLPGREQPGQDQRRLAAAGRPTTATSG